LEEARAHERSGAIAEAFAWYRDAAAAAGASGDHAIESEVLRRLAVLHHRRNERDTAIELATRSHAIALEIGDSVLAGEALNVVTAVGAVGGEAAKAWLVRRDVTYEESVPSVIVAKTTITLAQALFLLLGLLLAWLTLPASVEFV